MNTGTNNTFLGAGSGLDLQTGSGNTIVGANVRAGANISETIIIGTGSGTERLRIDSSGRLGIGTAAPKATLDVNGTARLAKYPAAPFACSAAADGALAMTSTYQLCACKGATAVWVKTTDGTSACSW